MRISHSSPPSLPNTFLSAQQNEEEEEGEEEYIVLGNFHQQKQQQQQQQQKVCQRTFVHQILLNMFAKETFVHQNSYHVCKRTLFIKFFLTCHI
jgi:hypothetical protein